MADTDFKTIGEIFQTKQTKKPPAYEWQDLALKIIEELRVPKAKRSSIFKACKNYPKPFIERCFNDTKELAVGDSYKYFFKLLNPKKDK